MIVLPPPPTTTTTTISGTTSTGTSTVPKRPSYPFQRESENILYIVQKFVCGSIAGGVSKFAIYPLDTVKKRLQIQVLYTSLGMYR